MNPDEQNKLPENPQVQNDPAVAPSNQGQVMDVQPPSAAPTEPESVPQPVQSNPAEATVAEVAAPTEPVVAAAPEETPEVVETPPAPVVQETQEAPQPAETPTSTEPTAPVAQDASSTPVTAAEMPKPHKASSPTVAIIAVAVVALLLSAIAVFVYMSSENDTPIESTTEQSSTTQSIPSTTSNESAIQAADDALALPDASSELQDDELTDESLGL